MASLRSIDNGTAPLHPATSIALILVSLVVYVVTLAFLAFMATVDAIERVVGPCLACGPFKVFCIGSTLVATVILSIFAVALYRYVLA